MHSLTDSQLERLQGNGRRRLCDPDFDPMPVVKLYSPDADATWLLASTDPDDPDMAYGLSDEGQGACWLGLISITDLMDRRGPLGMALENDLAFRPLMGLAEYAADARRLGAINA